ncbi:MAG: heterodisulfide reductase-related iron-sulfur binding cluster [Methylocystaceae bacterium]
MENLNHQQQEELIAIFGSRVNFDHLERKIYARDMGVMPSMVAPLVADPVPDGIVQPISEEEVVWLTKWALDNQVALTPRGKATSGYGGVLPIKKGLVVEFYRLRQILSIDASSGVVTVETGAVWQEIEYQLNQQQLALNLYPTSAPASTVGGWLAQGGAGIGSYEYGFFRDNVVAVNLVRPDGVKVTLSGEDIAVVADANGITGIITTISFKVKALAPLTVKAIAFANGEQLGTFLSAIYAEKFPLWSLSFINPVAARYKNQLPPHLHHGHAVTTDKITLPESYIVLAAFNPPPTASVLDALEQLTAANQGEMLSDSLADHEWQARFEPMRAKRIAPSFIPSEVVLPVAKLGAYLSTVAKEIKHPFILEAFGSRDAELILLGFIPHDERKFTFNLAFGLSLTALKAAQEFGGRPYATGLYFTGFADEVLGSNHLAAIKDFKAKYDPQDVMNPGKVMGNSLVASSLKMASKLEPIIRVFGNNTTRTTPGEAFVDKNGIPGDVAWYAYACSQCGYCVDQCDQYYGRGWESQSPRGKWTLVKMVLEGEIEFNQQNAQNIMACTTCEMCNHTCQLDLPNEASWMKLRQLLIDKQGLHTFPPFEIMVNTLRQQNNIWGEYAANRDGWVTEEITPLIKETSDYAYFPGCTSSFVEHDIAQSAARLLGAAGIEFAYLGKDETCCGIPMLVAGRWEVFDEIAARNIENMKKTGAKTVVTTCPACYLIWEVYYRQWAQDRGIDYPFTARHYADVLADKIKAGEFELPMPVNRKVTYHDPCHMGRAGGCYDGPRTLINAIPESNFRELRYNRDNAHCCGSVLTLVADPDIAQGIGAHRVQEALDVGADTLITACPCCRVQLNRSRNLENLPVEIKDLATLAAEAMGWDIPSSNAVIDEKWAVFEAMIRLMTPWGMADMMATMIPEMIIAMPAPFPSMMKQIKHMSKALRGPMLAAMEKMMPALFPRLLPGMMPALMPLMLEKVSEAIPGMPPDLQEQMPELMPKTMEVLMPKMLGAIIPYFLPQMMAYLRES